MSIANYGELKSELAVWLHNQSAKVTDRAADLVLMGESRINRELRLLDMITTQTGNLSTAARTLALPDRFAERVTFRLNSPVRNLTWTPPDKIDQYFGDSTSETGEPKRYTVTDSIEFDRIPDSEYSYTLKYYKGYKLTNDSDTNYLLTNYPQLYLFAAMRYGGIFIKDQAVALDIEPMLRQEIAAVKRAEAKRKGTDSAVMTTELGRSASFDIDTGE